MPGEHETYTAHAPTGAVVTFATSCQLVEKRGLPKADILVRIACYRENCPPMTQSGHAWQVR